jgi:hypothetical protein
MREYQVRICERLGVKFPGPTRHLRRADPATMTSGLLRLADILRVRRHVSKVPDSEVRRISINHLGAGAAHSGITAFGQAQVS